jgi:hypothetical protein
MWVELLEFLSTNSPYAVWIIVLIMAFEFIFGNRETRALEKTINKLDNRLGQVIDKLPTF